MKKIVCITHEIELELPTKDREFLIGNMHDNIVQLQSHHKQFPNCKFEEVQES